MSPGAHVPAGRIPAGRTLALAFAILIALALPAAAQSDATLDVLDGETLYEGGWLLTLGQEVERRDELASGWSIVGDPTNRRLTRRETVLGAHYGLRHDVQLSVLLPRVQNSLRQSAPGLPARVHAEGWGDLAALVKWRFHRWDAPGEAFNVALISGVELPTGADRVKSGGLLVAPELQPGSGSLDAFLGVAATYEPRRWRFNGLALWKRAGEGHDFRAGDDFFFELAAGNRFWLEPYPGPFMRLDFMLRHRHSRRASLNGITDNNSGGDLTTLGCNFAFRPRPALDFQVALEVPVSERVHGTQLAAGPSLALNFGYRF
ncbi:MAG: transporter [Planctomycetota bacterium]